MDVERERETLEDDPTRTSLVDLAGDPTPTQPPLDEGPPTARLVVLAGPGTGRRIALDGPTLLGRVGSEAGLVVEDPMVSRVHARLAPVAEGWIIEDLSSRNGTFVNGTRVTSAPIQFGDRLRIGHTLLLFSHHDALEEQLQSRQKFEAIGRLGATVAHDLNNLIGAVVASADHLRAQIARGLPDPASCGDSLDDIEAAMQRSADLVRRLLAFSRKAPRRQGLVDLERVCRDAAQLVSRSLPEGVSLEVDLIGECKVRGDSTLLHQMVLNLLVNARDATQALGGRVSIRTRRAVDAKRESVTGAWVELEVSDTGEGMDEATREQMFEPFFTTKGPERGSGLGLSIVMEAVTAHGGLLECESARGMGTKFVIRLPATRQRGESRTREIPLTTAPPPTPGVVLLVDDEPVVRRSLARVMSAGGHKVVEAAHGAAALDRVAANDALDVVVLDLDMPIMNGHEALVAIRAVRAELPVIVMTGHCDERQRRELLGAGALDVIEKPIEANALRARIDGILRRAAA